MRFVADSGIIASYVRYLGVGVVNTAVGYSVVLTGLHLGWGDYLANAASYGVGLTVSYLLQRRLVFLVETSASLPEMLRFGASAIGAYGINLSVIALGRHMGFIDNPIVQALAMASYSVAFFLMSRNVVFRVVRSVSRPGRAFR